MNYPLKSRCTVWISMSLLLLPLCAAEPILTTAGKDWKAIETDDLAVKPGTALDFSARLGTAPAGSKGQVIAMPDGRLAFSSEPTKPVRFFSCTLEVRNEVPSDPEGIEAFAEAIRAQGYNLVRVNFLDTALSGGYGKWGAKVSPDELAEFDHLAATGAVPFHEATLDKFDRFVAALKKRGIYLYMDAMTSWVGYYPVNPWSPGSNVVTNMGPNLFDPQSTGREHWRQCVKALYTRVNPYTKTSLVNDPQVIAILGHNELNLNFYFGNWRDKYEKALIPAWQRYLEKRYKTVSAWQADWGKIESPTEITSFSQIPFFTLDDVRKEGHRARVTGEFLAEAEDNLSTWFEKELRSYGYKGLYTQYDMLYNLRIYLSRAKMGLVSMHSYHDHPDYGNNGEFSNHNTSSLSESANWWRSLLACRIAGRPLGIMEYGDVWWNRYRYEEGLVVGAYGSFQDLSILSVHARPVELKGQTAGPFRPGSDPVGRASQVVIGLLFLQGEVAQPTHRVDVSITREQALNFSEANLPGDLSRLALVTGFAVAVEGTVPPVPATFTIPFSKGAKTQSDSIYTASVIDTGLGSFADYVAALREKGVLPESNRTSDGKEIYETETGQIYLSSGRKQLKVNTRTIAGITTEKVTQPLEAGSLHLEAASVPVSVTVAALDKADLPASARLLLVVATDAHNTNDKFSDADEKHLLKIGTLPILMRTGKFTLKINRAENAPSLRAWALAMDGTRRDSIKVQSVKGGIQLDLNTADWAVGPTPFIELAEQ